MDGSTALITTTIASLSLSVFLMAVYVVYTKIRNVTKEDPFRESMFERQISRQFESKQGGLPSFDAAQPATPAPITAMPISGITSPVLSRLISRLQAGGLMTRHEGPVRSAREDLEGALVELSGGRKVAILATGLDRTDPVLEALLRFHDGVIMPGPGETFIHIERVENLIAAHITPDKFAG